MKKLLLLLAFIATMLTSCVNNAEIDYSGKDAVDVVIGIDVPELAASRAGETDMNSGLGAIDNFTADEWAKYDVRYIFEVYDATEGYEDFDNPVKKRFVETHDMYEPTTFSLRLIPNRTYKFVVWADFVLQGSEDDLNYDTTDLKNISRIGNNTAYTTAMDESMDAYFIQENIYLEKNLSKSLTLTRPFGKIRVIATDVNEVNIGSEPKSVKVKFYDTDIFTSLNALTGEAETETQTVEYSYDIAKDAPYTQGYDADAKNQTLFADYILAQPKSAGAQEVNFTMEVIGVDNRVIRSHDFNTQIPLQRNHLTTIMGNLLTTSTEFQIFIDDNFDGEYLRNYEEETLAVESWGIGELNENGNYEYALSDGTHSFTLIVPSYSVNPTNGELLAGNMKYVVSEAELVNWDCFTIEGLAVDPTRAEFVEPTIVGGSMQVSDLYEGGSEIYINLEYTLDPTATTPVYETISFLFAGDTVAKTFLAYPAVEAKVVDNTITLTWDAVEGAEKYSITTGTEMPVITEELSYTFCGEYGAVYTFVVTAIPADE